MPSRKGISTTQYEKALRENAGIKSLAAKALGVSRSAVTQRVQGSPVLQAAIIEVEEGLLDVCDGAIVKAIHGDTASGVQPDMPTVRWYAERKGKARGYGNKIEADVRLSEADIEALVAAFGGDIKALRAFRASLDRPAAPGSSPTHSPSK